VPKPLDAAVRAAILTDIRAGTLSRNAIARAHGVSAGTVSNIARDAQLTTAFDRSQTVQATRAREADTASARADLAARRTALAEALQDDAERLRVQLWQPCVYGEFGGKENVWSQVDLDLPRFGDQRQILASVQTAVNTSAKLVPPADGGPGVDDAVSMLTNLAAGIRRIAEQEADSGE
jgi:hypothetical protein